MSAIRLGAVGYLNARPLVLGLEESAEFAVRFDLPSRCAQLLHDDEIDIGLIPSIEYLRGREPYEIVPDVGIVSRGEVASVALYTKREMADVRSIALDTSSRTSVALTEVLCARLFHIQPSLEARGPDLTDMLAWCDAALIIGDNALMLDHNVVGPDPIVKIDLGAAWFDLTGLPFVYAFWAGRAEMVTGNATDALIRARDEGVTRLDSIARAYFPEPAAQRLAAAYLRDNIKYHMRDEELTGLETFYRYAAELGLAEWDGRLRIAGGSSRLVNR